jgi:hypothetical protein
MDNVQNCDRHIDIPSSQTLWVLSYALFCYGLRRPLFQLPNYGDFRSLTMTQRCCAFRNMDGYSPYSAQFRNKSLFSPSASFLFTV